MIISFCDINNLATIQFTGNNFSVKSADFHTFNTLFSVLRAFANSHTAGMQFVPKSRPIGCCYPAKHRHRMRTIHPPIRFTFVMIFRCSHHLPSFSLRFFVLQRACPRLNNVDSQLSDTVSSSQLKFCKELIKATTKKKKIIIHKFYYLVKL